jgi:hypothetical protein
MEYQALQATITPWADKLKEFLYQPLPLQQPNLRGSFQNGYFHAALHKNYKMS